jgi:hypothetical protein
VAGLSPILKPENSVIAGLAVIGLVIATYNLNVGTTAAVGMTPAWDPNVMSSSKKAGWEALALVAGVSLLARDPNIVILGGAAILAMHTGTIHAMAVHPQTGQIVPQSPTAAAYAPAQAA